MHSSSGPARQPKWCWIAPLASCLFLGPQRGLCSEATSATNRYEFRQEHDPDGTGKFCLGREIAQVMSHTGADWLERSERNREEHTERLVEELRVEPGDTVADIGSGSGYFSRRLAAKVGTEGKVMAVDVQPEMLRILTNKMALAGITNVVPVLGDVNDPKLPAGSIDLTLLVDVYHEFEFPFEMMRAICAAMKPGGRVVLAEYRAEDPSVPIKPIHKMTEAQVKKEMAMHPLQWLETVEVLPRQHLITFRKHVAEIKAPQSRFQKTQHPHSTRSTSEAGSQRSASSAPSRAASAN